MIDCGGELQTAVGGSGRQREGALPLRIGAVGVAGKVDGRSQVPLPSTWYFTATRALSILQRKGSAGNLI